MRGLIKLVGALFLLLFAFGCDSDDSSDDISMSRQLMVEAYVYANEHVNHIKVGRVHSEGEADLIPVNDANIKLTQGGFSATLELKNEAEGIYQIADPELVFSGPEPLQLEIVYEGITYTSTTSFPEAVEELKITSDQINITEALNEKIALTRLSWSPVSGAQWYCIFSKGWDTDTTFTYPTQASNDSPLFSLHAETSVDLYADHFTHIGNYQLYVSAVNKEYAQMYALGSGPELQGAPSNIEGAWGVFTAFNGRSVDISVE